MPVEIKSRPTISRDGSAEFVPPLHMVEESEGKQFLILKLFVKGLIQMFLHGTDWADSNSLAGTPGIEALKQMRNTECGLAAKPSAADNLFSEDQDQDQDRNEVQEKKKKTSQRRKKQQAQQQVEDASINIDVEGTRVCILNPKSVDDYVAVELDATQLEAVFQFIIKALVAKPPKDKRPYEKSGRFSKKQKVAAESPS